MSTTAREKIISLGKEAIITTLKEEQRHNSEAFQGPITEFKVVSIDNNMVMSFSPKLLLGSIQGKFVSKLSALVLELKRYMVDADFGAWISAQILMNPDNDTYLFLFNYDEHLEEFDKFPKEAFLTELRLYPRNKTFVPDWWDDILDSA